MAYYIKFDENGVQQEAVSRSSKPAGDGWYKADGKDFDFAKRYRLDPDETIREETEAENESLFVALARGTAVSETQAFLETVREKHSGYSSGKNKAYEAQARSALRVLAAEDAGESIDALDNQILGEMASVRSVTVPEMAALIKAKMDETDVILGLIEGYEDRAMQIIEDATNRDTLRSDLETLRADLETAIAAL